MSLLNEKKEAILAFKGPMAAVLTPYDEQGMVDVSQIGKYAKYLFEIGVKGVFILGTTGESYSLSLDEKLLLVRGWNSALKQLYSDHGCKMMAIVNLSATCVAEIKCLATEVESLEQLTGVALLPPLYYRVTSSRQLVNYVHSILASCPSSPFLYYHIPSFTGALNFELEQFLKEGLEKISHFCAIKFTDANIVRFESVQANFGDKLKIFAGFDETILATKALGCEAAICATFSLQACVAHYGRIVDAVDRADWNEARTSQRAIATECVRLRQAGNFFASIKAKANQEAAGKGIRFGKPRMPVSIEDVATAQP